MESFPQDPDPNSNTLSSSSSPSGNRIGPSSTTMTTMTMTTSTVPSSIRTPISPSTIINKSAPIDGIPLEYETWITVKTRTTEKNSNRNNNSSSLPASPRILKQIWAFPATTTGVYLGKNLHIQHQENNIQHRNNSSAASFVSSAGNLLRSTAKLMLGGNTASTTTTTTTKGTPISSSTTDDNTNPALILDENCGIPDESLLPHHAFINLADNLYDIQFITEGRSYMLIGQGTRYPKLPPQPLELETILKMGACSVMITDLATGPRARSILNHVPGPGASSDHTCCICFDDTNTDDNVLEPSPCVCSKLVHRQCLTKWVATKGSRFCSICKGRLPIDTAVNPPFLVLQVVRHMRGIPWTGEREYIISFQGREPQMITVGCSNDCDLVIPDPSLSRIHARISYENKVFYVEDLGSSAGTYIKIPPNKPLILSNNNINNNSTTTTSSSLLNIPQKSLMTTFKMGRTMVTIKIKRKRNTGILPQWIRKSTSTSSISTSPMMENNTLTTTLRPQIDIRNNNHINSPLSTTTSIPLSISNPVMNTTTTTTTTTKTSLSSNTLSVRSPKSPSGNKMGNISSSPKTTNNNLDIQGQSILSPSSPVTTTSTRARSITETPSTIPGPNINTMTTVITSHTPPPNSLALLTNRSTQENKEPNNTIISNDTNTNSESSSSSNVLSQAYYTLYQNAITTNHTQVSYGVPIPLHLLASGTNILQEEEEEDEDDVDDPDE